MSALRELDPVNPRVRQSVSESSEAPSSPARRRSRNDSISSNLNITNSSITSVSDSKIKRKQYKVFRNAISDAEASLKLAAHVVDDLEDASTENSLTRAVNVLGDSPDTTFQSENDADNSKSLVTLLRRVGPAACLPVVLGMQEKVKASLHSYNTYLNALEQLLEDACESVEGGGLSTPEILGIHDHLETTVDNIRIVQYQKYCLENAALLMRDMVEADGVEVSINHTVKEFHAKEVLLGMPAVESGAVAKEPASKRMRERVERWRDLLKSRNIHRPRKGTAEKTGNGTENAQEEAFPDDESLASDGEAEHSMEV